MAYFIYADGKWYDSDELAALTTDRERAKFWKSLAERENRRANNLRDGLQLAVGSGAGGLGRTLLFLWAVAATAVAVLT